MSVPASEAVTYKIPESTDIKKRTGFMLFIRYDQKEVSVITGRTYDEFIHQIDALASEISYGALLCKNLIMKECLSTPLSVMYAKNAELIVSDSINMSLPVMNKRLTNGIAAVASRVVPRSTNRGNLKLNVRKILVATVAEDFVSKFTEVNNALLDPNT